MTSKEKIESYLLKSSLTFEEAGAGSWLVRDREKGIEDLLIMLVDSLVVMRIKVMPLPSAGRQALFEEMLRLNATDMVHGAYALDGSDVIITDTLEAEGMGVEEFQASVDAIGLALAQHYRTLSKYRAKK